MTKFCAVENKWFHSNHRKRIITGGGCKEDNHRKRIITGGGCKEDNHRRGIQGG
ncbi:hypothetical protein DPMN_168171 [Dreissena polymorpha]|uniref:Uncharacterized protein n=1 Tax=Dreissena polymorpha TaxID=45954 RepID=A0A9D4IZE6_DREPO|nr:hypothetical protein DPMN_168171 [Dreissena polymorpha]